jgi:hypothetical protein
MSKEQSRGRNTGMRHCAAVAAFVSITAPTGVQADEPPPDTTSCSVFGSVHLNRIDVFDTSIPEEDNAVFRLANWLHFKTRDSTLAQLLLFKAGDPYDPRLLKESERLLRGTGYLHDATIRPLACHDGAVDVEVVAQDVWTLKPGISFSRKGGENSSGFGLEESNLMGLGIKVGVDFKSGVDRNTRTLSYRDPVLGSKRLDLSGEYADNSDGRSRSLALEQPFYALDSRRAAGVSWKRETRVESVYEQGQLVGNYQAKEHGAELYAGFSEGLRNGWVRRWTVGWTHDELRVDRIALAPTSTVTPPADRKLVYPWLGLELLEDKFEEARNQDQIGKTEDVALGWHLKAQVGAALPGFGSDRRATVFNARLTKGLQPRPNHTVLFDAKVDGRVEHQRLAGTLFSGSARYYLRQSPRRSLFLGLAVDRGVNPDAEQQVKLGGDSGLRGYPLRYQTGQGRWLLNVEQRYFTEWYPFRLFNVGGAVFYDMGRVWDQDARTQNRQGLLRDLGFGLRLGNSRSAIGHVVHIDVAFPLDGDSSIRRVQFLVEAKSSF